MRLRPAAACFLMSVIAGCGGGDRAPATAPEPSPDATVAAEPTAAADQTGKRGEIIEGPRGGDLVLALHGVGGPAATPEVMREVSGLGKLAEREKFTVVFADGEGDWDDDDIPYLRGLLDAVPHKRAFVVGWSGGGFMVHRVACELSGRIDAIAVLQAPLRGRCRPSKPVSVLQIVGTADDVIPPGGGTTPDGTETPPVAKAMARWRTLNGCRASGGGCRGGARVKLVRIRGGGHDWYPSATRTLWRFFSTVPR